MKHLRKNRKFVVILSIMLTIVMVASVTFAWFTAQATKINHFENQGYTVSNTVVVGENFPPVYDWRPGDTVAKEVYVVNTGDGDVLARVSFEEMLKILGANGEVTLSESSTLTEADGYIRALLNLATYTASASWTELTIAAAPGVTLPGANVHILKHATSDVVIAYYEFETGKAQSMSAIGSINETTNTFTLSENAKYKYFTAGTAEFISWFGKNVTNWSYTPGSTFPTTADIATSQLTEMIIFGYGDVATTYNSGATTGEAKWYYSQADGYFYYLDVLAGGTSTTMLLNTLTLSGAAGDAFQKLDYDLAITVEAVQATALAIGDGTTTGPAWTIADTTLLAYLQGLCG